MNIRPVIIFTFCVVVVSVQGAPRSRSGSGVSTLYDQRQKGDYNIQLHLKDFQIIALLSDDYLAGLGDYDYDYDYSDYTIKPKPSTSTTPSPANNSSVETTSAKPIKEPLLGSTKPTPTPTPVPSDKTTSPTPSSAPPVTNQASSSPASSSPDRINVQIIQSSPVGPVLADDLTLLPDEKLPTARIPVPLSEVTHYRRCLSGFQRDKSGKCRRIRRPSGSFIPFGFRKLANNFAARIKGTSSEEPSDSLPLNDQ